MDNPCTHFNKKKKIIRVNSSAVVHNCSSRPGQIDFVLSMNRCQKRINCVTKSPISEVVCFALCTHQKKKIEIEAFTISGIKQRFVINTVVY